MLAEIPIEVGDDSAIWVLGSEAQEKLGSATKILLSTMAEGRSNETTDLLATIIGQIDLTQNTIPSSRSFFPFKRKDDKKDRYKGLINQISQLSVQLQLRQAQLVKEITIMDRLLEVLTQCIDTFEMSIAEGDRILSAHSNRERQGESFDILEDSLLRWCSRLEKRIEELRMGKIVAAQSSVQVKLIREGDEDLLQKLRSVVSTTIPLWRNQVSLTMGLEQINENINLQKKLFLSTKTDLNVGRKQLKSQNEVISRQDDDTKNVLHELLSCSQDLRDSLVELSKLETSVKSIGNRIVEGGL